MDGVQNYNASHQSRHELNGVTTMKALFSAKLHLNSRWCTFSEQEIDMFQIRILIAALLTSFTLLPATLLAQLFECGQAEYPSQVAQGPWRA